MSPADGSAAFPMEESRLRPLDIRHVVIQPAIAHPSSANGLHNVVRSLIAEQRAMGDDARLCLFSDDPDALTGIPADCPAQRFPLGGPRLSGRSLTIAEATLDRLLEGAGPDTVVHIHGAVKPLFAALARGLHRRGVAYGVTLHGQCSHIYDIAGRVRRRLPAAWLRVFDGPAFARARFVHAITEEEAAIVRRAAPTTAVRLLPNTAWSARHGALPAPIPRAAPYNGRPTFGYCARYEIEHKGVDLLIDGFAAYRRAGGRGVLELAGSGPARTELERRANAHGLGTHIRIHGPIFGAEKTAMMAGWHYFALTSRFDVMPTGCLEAALSGLPLIVTRETGLVPYVEGHGAGFGVSALTAEAVADALMRAERTGPGAWQSMAANAHRMVVAIGDWGRIAGRLRAAAYGRPS
ncbi:glycosyltransferase [Azospirillum brasilense]|uniref:glycosyltransferase family 4 protein n=1 Tax=Azospirillum brasilense TaxID=192 RepID=UPI000E693C6A|nr:glycosyltransferase [Azospirillum brasilense]NUB13984.1 glycosyltransferase [Azospirillum brasilense]NUB25552.1 glycosyltransferase [Azospirillum brasilense]NUB32374.1 glycosyltransferase [Azospirillum brasilense]RIW06572.1 glycosyltransferase [Azospirillum brasilense]